MSGSGIKGEVLLIMFFNIIRKDGCGMHVLFGRYMIVCFTPYAMPGYKIQRFVKQTHKNQLGIGGIAVKQKKFRGNGFDLRGYFGHFRVVKEKIFSQPFFNKRQGNDDADTGKMVGGVNIAAGVGLCAVDKDPVRFAEIEIICTGIETDTAG